MTHKILPAASLIAGLLLVAAPAPAQEAQTIIEAAFVRCYPEAKRCEVRPMCEGCKPLRVDITEETRLLRDGRFEAVPELVIGIADVAFRNKDNVALWFQLLDAR